MPSAASGDAASNATRPLPRRLRRMHRVWPDRDGNISYLLTLCVERRGRVLNNESIFERFTAFLLDSPTRYRWFGRRFVIMPDHIHLIAHMGYDAVRLGQWIKALKAVVGGLERRQERWAPTPVRHHAASGDAVDIERSASRALRGVPSRSESLHPESDHEFTRIQRVWRWQEGYHDHKFRTPESETRKWEYVCLNPVRAGFVKRPEEWRYGGEVFYDETDGPRLVRCTPSLLETGVLIDDDDGGTNPREGTRLTV